VTPYIVYYDGDGQLAKRRGDVIKLRPGVSTF